MTSITLDALGWNEWFASQAGRCGASDSAARVAAVDRDQLLLIGEPGLFRARLSGRYLYETEATSARPCVGDWVCVQRSAHDQYGVVHAILDRQTALRRKAPGDSGGSQMIAANLDFVIVVQSCHYDFNLKRLERYLVMVKDGGAAPLVLLTKTDLVAPEVLADQIEQIRRAAITEPLLTLSNLTQEGVDELRSVLTPGKTYCFVGSSGVGKSTIINTLTGRDVHETKGVSATGEGRHTTVRRELLLLDNGVMVIDTPGMREFGVAGAEEGIEASYSDIGALAALCRFRDCTHTGEPGCAVSDALQQGVISSDRFENFMKLRKESEYGQLSYAEKRKKDRDFGRFIKSAMKGREEE